MRRSKKKSRAVSEVVSSVAMLAITIAVLGGIAVISLGSLRSANGVLLTGAEDAANNAGVLISVVGTQGNSSGTYVWFFDYGWVSTKLTAVYVDGGLVQGWTSTCSNLQPKEMCALQLPPGTHGTATIDFGARTISLSI